MDKSPEILERIHSIERILDRNTVSLETHMKRTELNEENLELLRRDVRVIEKHVLRVDGVAKFIAFCGTVAALVVAITKLI